MKDPRPDKHNYYLNIALEVSKRSTCMRRRYGAVIVNNDQIVSTGYAGAPRGAKNCIDLNFCLRERANVPQGERYELCRSVHAEMNAVIHASREEMLDGTIYISGTEVKSGDILLKIKPCKLCTRVIINAGLKEVVVWEGPNNVHVYNVRDWIAEEEINIPL